MMNRSISSLTLLFAAVSAILGSGWLFSAYYTAKLAGPGAILSWVLGGGAVIVVAFVFAELSTMLPITGSSTRIPQFTHGTIVSFIFSWMIWLSYASLVATEVQAVIQYLSFYFPSFTLPTSGLTHTGYAVAACLMLAISAINIFSLRWLMRCNTFLTALKIIIPVVICLALLLKEFSFRAVIHPGGCAFLSCGLKGVFAAISSGGIVFAFNGFKQACEMAGEAKNPNKTVPFAIIGSVVLTLAIYLLLQITFFSSLTVANLIHGFAHMQLPHSDSPFAAIVSEQHMAFLQIFLYIGAVIGPLAAGLMYMSSASRALYGKSKNGYLPVFLQTLTPQGNPVYAIGTSFLLGMCLFAPLPGWDKMITFLTSLMAITYGVAPVCLLTLRRQLPDQARPFKLPYARCWSNFAFIICNCMTYFSGWNIISKLSIALCIGFLILLLYHFFTERGRGIEFHWRSSMWIWPYFMGLSLISYLGSFGHGLGLIPFGWDCVVVAIFSLLIMQLAIWSRLHDNETQAYIEDLKLPPR